MNRLLKLSPLAALSILVALALPSLASAADVPGEAPTLLLPYEQLWTLIIGSLVPLVTYVLNHYAPWVSEKTKAAVLVVAAAVAGALYQAIADGNVGFNNQTVTIIFTAIVGALTAHHWLWRPSTISLALGGGSNAQDNPRR